MWKCVLHMCMDACVCSKCAIKARWGGSSQVFHSTMISNKVSQYASQSRMKTTQTVKNHSPHKFFVRQSSLSNAESCLWQSWPLWVWCTPIPWTDRSSRNKGSRSIPFDREILQCSFNPCYKSIVDRMWQSTVVSFERALAVEAQTNKYDTS